MSSETSLLAGRERSQEQLLVAVGFRHVRELLAVRRPRRPFLHPLTERQLRELSIEAGREGAAPERGGRGASLPGAGGEPEGRERHYADQGDDRDAARGR